ncbi:CLIP domain-containing serine protease B8-like [Wyeomyia smithii]|uniref:CLIP domain-containing serine protease B8-like n=1 Tax=Wyeomyia smithii TaxID=174621 RepID=UPI002467B0BC|nr:CLIP domain-containing serine protease B8-like [Wyeomyia smithii]
MIVRFGLVVSICSLLIESIGARRLEETQHVRNSSCEIPGELVEGVCISTTECVAFRKLTNDSEVNLIDREEFVERLKCGKHDGTEICCPHGESYNLPEEKDELCGVQVPKFKIKGGVIADIDEFPWTAMLLRQNRNTNSLYYHCGAALISRTFVLTAAHCIAVNAAVEKQDPLKFVRLREYNIFQDPDCVLGSGFMDCAEGKLDFKPRSIVIYPGFTLDSPRYDHDIGLIQIDPVPAYSDFLRPICLPELELENGARPGGVFNVAGWGKTDFFSKDLGSISFSPIKLKVVLPFFALEQCKKVYESLNASHVRETQLCAGGRRAKDSCAGDSGSPLMHYDRRKAVWVLTGVASYGVQDCGRPGVPSVYTNVREYLTWIKQNIKSLQDP